MSDIIKFEFRGKQVRVVRVDDHEEWVAKDVCEVLELGHVGSALRSIDADERGSVLIEHGTGGGDPHHATVTEPGLYSLIFRSRKRQAREFKRWVTHEVLPQLRKSGYYVAPGAEQKAFEELRAALGQTMEQNRQLIENVTVLVTTVVELRQRLDVLERAHPMGLMGHDAKMLRAQITALAWGKMRLGDRRSLLENWTDLDNEVRDAIGYPRRGGARWESCPVELGAKAFSMVIRMVAKQQKATDKAAAKVAKETKQQELFKQN